MRKLPVLGRVENAGTEASRMAVYADFPARAEGFGADGLPPLTDARGRAYRYLRLSVTDRCDLACVYCMPPGGEEEHAVRKELLSFEEAARVVQVFAAQGIRRVRFTGGEPLVRKDVVRLVELVHRRTPVEELVMTTNATRLAELARPLRNAGLSGVNVSLDSLDADRFRELTRGGDLKRVLAGIHAALDVGMEVKINTVLMRGRTDDEALRLVDWAWDLGATPRFIELMPLGEGAKLPASTRMSADDVIALFGDRLEDGYDERAEHRGPARYLRSKAGRGRVGFITPLSNEFCGSCNRVRVTARGDIRACLASRRALSLRDVMRAGGDDRDLAWAMHWALGAKDEGHFFLDPAEREHESVG
ncbi:MAG: GTP 3',8-cyclase MoaA, partial [Myxococcota bacterium]